jgi:ubiquinone/menaquinone biosynthesis C-methylase UbiE
MDENKKSLIQGANIRYHTKLAETYDKTQPNFNPENVIQVTKRIEQYAKTTSGKRLLDLGCGTGFVLSLAHPYFEELVGIDITPAMLDCAADKYKQEKVNNIKLIEASSDELPFSDSYFDVVTGYGFLHHLPSLLPTFKETYRVLADGGIFYSDLDPNYYFWETMKSLPTDAKGISELLETERKSVCDMVEGVQTIVGNDLDCETIEMAEYLKSQGGFKEETVIEQLGEAGFKDINYEYTWYWQEGMVIRALSLEAALYFENHLRAALPLTRGFFKYVRIVAIK